MDNPVCHSNISAMDADILITGGGLVGAAMGLAAATTGLSAIVVDQLPLPTRTDPDFDGRAYALSAASVRLLTHIGLWSQVSERAEPIRQVIASDGRPGEGAAPQPLIFDPGPLAEPMGHLLEDRHLRQALLDALPGAGVRHIAPEAVVAQSARPGHVEITTAAGIRLTARLLIGADGTGSGTATRAGICRQTTPYHQSTIVCAVAHDRPHGGIAHQIFLPGGPFAILPLIHQRCAINWAEASARAQAIAALPDEAFLDHLRPRFGDFLGDIRLEGQRAVLPLGLSIAESFTAPRLALVGDAARTVHPLAGQGLNAGLKDVAALAHVLRDARRRGEDIASPATLAEFARWRRTDSAGLALATHGFNLLFSNDNTALRLIRDTGLAAVNLLPGLKHTLMREAAGLTGELPFLMRPI